MGKTATTRAKQEKRFYSVADIEQMFSCGRNKASQIIREIKAYSNSLPIRGKVLVTDFEVWYNRPNAQFRGANSSNQ